MRSSLRAYLSLAAATLFRFNGYALLTRGVMPWSRDQVVREQGHRSDLEPEFVKSVDRIVQRAVLRKLEIVHAAKDVEDQCAMANLFCLDGWRCGRCRTRRLPLRRT